MLGKFGKISFMAIGDSQNNKGIADLNRTLSYFAVLQYVNGFVQGRTCTGIFQGRTEFVTIISGNFESRLLGRRFQISSAVQ